MQIHGCILKTKTCSQTPKNVNRWLNPITCQSDTPKTISIHHANQQAAKSMHQVLQLHFYHFQPKTSKFSKHETMLPVLTTSSSSSWSVVSKRKPWEPPWNVRLESDSFLFSDCRVLKGPGVFKRRRWGTLRIPARKIRELPPLRPPSNNSIIRVCDSQLLHPALLEKTATPKKWCRKKEKKRRNATFFSKKNMPRTQQVGLKDSTSHLEKNKAREITFSKRKMRKITTR